MPTFIQGMPHDPQGTNTGACNNTADHSDACHVYHYCTPDGGVTFYLGVNLETGPDQAITAEGCSNLSGGHKYYVRNQQ